MNFEEFATIMSTNSIGYLATVSSQNTPDVRMWEIPLIEDGKIYFRTSSNKTVFEQMQANPSVSFYCKKKDYTFRIYGKAFVEKNIDTINKIHAGLGDAIKKHYPTTDANGFCVMCIQHGKVSCQQGFSPVQWLEF